MKQHKSLEFVVFINLSNCQAPLLKTFWRRFWYCSDEDLLGLFCWTHSECFKESL